jgi:hypothetical protein
MMVCMMRPQLEPTEPALRIAAVILAVSMMACGGDVKEEVAPVTETASATRAAVLPVTLDRAQLARLKWIEGTWKGTGDSVPAFFERYSFPNDSTMLSEGFPDSTLAVVNDSSYYMLRDGQFGNMGDGARWVATAMDEKSIHFEPVAKARNNFTWTRVSADEWRAELVVPASAGGAESRRVYVMKRLR